MCWISPGSPGDGTACSKGSREHLGLGLGFLVPKGFQDRAIRGCFGDGEGPAAGRMGSGQGPLENTRIVWGQWLAPGIKWELLDNPHFCSLGRRETLIPCIRMNRAWSHSLGVTMGTSSAVAVPGATRAHCWTWLLLPRAVCFCRKLPRNSKLPHFPYSLCLQCSSPTWKGMFITYLSSSLASDFSHRFTSLDFTSLPF